MGKHPVITLSDLDTSSREPRVYDLTLAAKLGFEHARNIRRLIKNNRAELETHGTLAAVDDRTGGTGELVSDGANPKAGRPGRAFYLNEGQALVICALTRTPTGAMVRGELIRVFMMVRHRGAPFDLRRAERKALQAIVQSADVVFAPPAHAMPYTEGMMHCGASDMRPIGFAHDGNIPYLMAPITESILETLAEFEADEADYEDGSDAEETNEDGGDIQDVAHDNEDDADEPSDDDPIFAYRIAEHVIDAERAATREACERLGAVIARLTGVPAGSAVRR